MVGAFLKFDEQCIDVLRFGDEIRFPKDFLKINVIESVLTGLKQIVLNMQDSDDVVRIVPINRNSGITKFNISGISITIPLPKIAPS